jgi:hypothetical protein
MGKPRETSEGAVTPAPKTDRLYGLPLDEFTSARNALARELKRSGDSDAAAQVQKLAKPTRAAGAINRVVRRNRRDARRLLSAADKLGQAQERLLREGGRRSIDQAVEEERSAVDRLMAEVEAELGSDGGSSQSMLERARDTLHAVATIPELRGEFEAGRITKDHKAVGFGSLSAATGRSAPKGATTAKKQDRARQRLKRAEQEVESAERALRRAQAERDQAEKRLASAEAAVTSSERDLADATGARDAARVALERE